MGAQLPYRRDDTLIVPLTDIWHKNFKPFEANSETPVPLQWYSAADAPYLTVHPEIDKEGIVSLQATAPVTREAQIKAFFRGGSLDGQS